jgi:hypothetical protein
MTIDAAFVATGAFLQPFMPTGTQIVRGQANNTPPPKSPFVLLTEVGQNQYTTTRTKLVWSVDQMSYVMPKILNIQMDFYGPSAGDMCNAAITMLRSVYGPANFPDGIEPLYCSDAMQAPLITGEKQYEKRWLTTLSVQYNSPVVAAQQSFNTVGEVVIDPVDVTIPVE